MTKPPRITDIRADWLYPPDKQEQVRQLELVIGHRMPNLNDIIRMQGGRKGIWTRAKQAYEKAVKLEWVAAAIRNGGMAQVIKGAYSISYTLYCADAKTDPSNLFAGAEKVILDALVSCGALEGDGFKFHRKSSFEAAKANRWAVCVKVKGASDG